MKTIRDSKTAENLLKAFAGESQARNRYTYYAEIAENEGLIQIANIFLETAGNERAHARRFFGFLSAEFRGKDVAMSAAYPVGLGTTEDNLRYAAAGEYEEWSKLYPSFGDVAEQEGFDEIAACFRKVAEAEVRHEQRFLALNKNLEAGYVFSRPEVVEWKCTNCGFVHSGKTAPAICPTCLYTQSYFELNVQAY